MLPKEIMLQKAKEKMEKIFKKYIIIDDEAYLPVDLILQLFNINDNPISNEQLISFWISVPQTLETLANWESIHNPDFIYSEYEKLKEHGCPLENQITVLEWIIKTRAIGIKNITGKNEGVFLQKDVATDIILSLNEHMLEFAKVRRKELEENIEKLRKEYDEKAKLN